MELDELAAKQVINDKVIVISMKIFYGDFYDFFVNFMKFKELTGQMKKSPDEVEFVFYLKNDDNHYGYKLVFDQIYGFCPRSRILVLQCLEQSRWKILRRVGM